MPIPLMWTPAGRGHELALDGTTLRCRKSNGEVLPSVPRAVRSGPTGARFSALRERLLRHEAECRSGVESWLLAGVPVPAALLARVWPDPIWRSCLENLVVDAGGSTGLLAEVTEEGRAVLVGLDGSTQVPAEVRPVTVLHPVLIPDLGGWGDLLAGRGAVQGVPQTERQVHGRPAGVDDGAAGLEDFAGGRFAKLRHASARAVDFGFAVRGGFAVRQVADGDAAVQARFWLGADDPNKPAETGRLLWVDAAERPVPLGRVGAVAWSEGVRMAELIYAGRASDEQ